MQQRDKIKPILLSIIKHSSPEELKRQIPRDIVAGIVVAIVALPLSIALGIASGVSPEQGLYTAIVAGFLIAFLGGSRVQISGPTAAFATIVAGIVATDGMDGLIAATIIAGILLILMGLFKLGAVIRFVPFTITTGFTAGIAVTLAIGQLKDFLGLTYPAGTATVETVDKVAALAGNIATVNVQACIVGLVCLAVLFLWPRLVPRVPSSLMALFAGVALVSGLGSMNMRSFRKVAVGQWPYGSVRGRNSITHSSPGLNSLTGIVWLPRPLLSTMTASPSRKTPPSYFGKMRQVGAMKPLPQKGTRATPPCTCPDSVSAAPQAAYWGK